MFDKLFQQDERVLLHNWEVLFARFRMVAGAGRTAYRFRDVLAYTVLELLSAEADLARFGRRPADQLTDRDADLWRASAAWVTACREWAVPPAGWGPARVQEALDRRRRLEAAVYDAVEAYSVADEADECPDDAVVPAAVR